MKFQAVAAIATVLILSCSVHADPKGRIDLRITGGFCAKTIDGGDRCEGIDTRGQKSNVLYQRLGRTKSALQQKNYKLVQDSCTNNGNFYGYQWVQISESPLSHAVLLDKQGTVAGVQFLMPYSEVDTTQSPNYRYDLQPAIQNVTIRGIEYFAITVYYLDPSLICSEGRHHSQLDTDGTVSQLYIQNGSPENSMKLAMTSPPKSSNDKELLKGWAINNCYRWMGWHRFYRQDLWHVDSCQTFQPFFLMYDNDGNLNGYGYVVPGKASSLSIERPSVDLTMWTAGTNNNTEEVPKCLEEAQNLLGMSSMHVYLAEEPWKFKCSNVRDSNYNPGGYDGDDMWEPFDFSNMTPGKAIRQVKDAVIGFIRRWF